jgi:hypothetical protein
MPNNGSIFLTDPENGGCVILENVSGAHLRRNMTWGPWLVFGVNIGVEKVEKRWLPGCPL